jgi:hypothetical protein
MSAAITIAATDSTCRNALAVVLRPQELQREAYRLISLPQRQH